LGEYRYLGVDKRKRERDDVGGYHVVGRYGYSAARPDLLPSPKKSWNRVSKIALSLIDSRNLGNSTF
jgi:hypothetical protein